MIMQSEVYILKKQIYFFTSLLLLSVTIFISTSVVTITEYKLSYDNLPKEFDGFKILQLSDLHSADFGNNNEILIKKIDSVKPDIMVFTGDMINRDDINFDVFFDFCKEISKKYKIYYIYGNHEMDLNANNAKILYDGMVKNNIKIINNKKITIKKGKSQINLYGLKYPTKYYGKKDENSKYVLSEEDIVDYIKEANKDEFNIMLTHNPNYFDLYTKWGADLTLTGHIHGGMIRIPFVGGIFSPDRIFFPKYDSGIYEQNGKNMIVNRGIGGEKGVRIFNNPEMVLIILKSNS